MDLLPFPLEQWLAEHDFSNPPIRFNLAASTGPNWTLKDVLALVGEDTSTLDNIKLTYAPPEGHRALRARISATSGADPDWVVVTTGASEAMSILLCLCAQPGGNVVLPSITFSPFNAMAMAWGLGLRPYEMSETNGFRQTAEHTLDAVDHDTRLVIVNSPHNPTGSVMPRAEIEILAAELKRRKIPLVVDEVYHALYYGKEQHSAVGIDNAIVVGDMSKTLSLAGLRTGWIIDPDAERRKRIILARMTFTVCGSPILEAVTEHALRAREQLVSRTEAVAKPNLVALEGFMALHANTLSWVRPEGGTVAFPWFRNHRNSRQFCELLARKGVLVAPGDCFGMPHHIRIGFGAQADDFPIALEIMAEALREMQLEA